MLQDEMHPHLGLSLRFEPTSHNANQLLQLKIVWTLHLLKIFNLITNEFLMLNHMEFHIGSVYRYKLKTNFA